MDIIEKKIEESWQPYIQALGEVAHSWNQLHEALAYLFSCATGTNQNVAYAVWHAVRSDLAQRHILKDAVAVSDNYLEKWPNAQAEINWIIDRTNELANRRNDAIHAPVEMELGFGTGQLFKISASHFTGNPRALSLKGKDLVKEFHWYRNYSDTLIDYTKRISLALTWPDEPWPERPSLPKQGEIA